MLALIGGLLLCLGMPAHSARGAAPLDSPGEQLLSEQKHFAECLGTVYSPGWWFSYNDALYFLARTEAQVKQLEAMRASRSKYLALTNQEARHALAAKVLTQSGISETWRSKLLLPFCATNQTLTPTLDRPVRFVPKYKVLQLLPSGDALIQAEAFTGFVMNYGRGPDDAACTNAMLIREGVKTYTAGGKFMTVEAFTDVTLSREEIAVLERVVSACQKEAAAAGLAISKAKYGEEFESYKARASDSSPYMEYLLAKAYLEGRGTEKNERLGMEWLNRAAKSGSGDAQSYLEAMRRKGS